jgi:hypothetical protein
MLGSHFSSGAFMVLAAVPFLLSGPILEWRDKLPTSAESRFCISMLAALALGGLAIILAKGLASGGSVGVIGLLGAGGFNNVFFMEYAAFLLPVLLGLIMLRHKPAILFLSWLGMGILLSQPLFTQPGFQTRFAWDAYVPVAILTGIGLGYFWEDRRAFIGACLIVCIIALAGFVRVGLEISPIIYQEEWDGLLRLHSERPDIVFSRIFGGAGQWAGAAGFEVTEELKEGSCLLVCDSTLKEENDWYGGACQMTVHAEKDSILRMPVLAHFGRFYVVPAGALPQGGEGHPGSPMQD